jgi:hypothetical protein
VKWPLLGFRAIITAHVSLVESYVLKNSHHIIQSKNVRSHRCHSALKFADAEQTGCNMYHMQFFGLTCDMRNSYFSQFIIGQSSLSCHVTVTVSTGWRVPKMFVTTGGHVTLFKTMRPLKNVHLAQCCTSKCYLHNW